VATGAAQIETRPGFFRRVCRVPANSADPLPGQFVQLRLNERSDPLLPRPYGIVDFRRESDHAIFELYYGVVGAGTRILARFRSGETIPCIGPLGRGYAFDPDRAAILVAGGGGVAPLHLFYAAQRPKGGPSPVGSRHQPPPPRIHPLSLHDALPIHTTAAISSRVPAPSNPP